MDFLEINKKWSYKLWVQGDRVGQPTVVAGIIIVLLRNGSVSTDAGLKSHGVARVRDVPTDLATAEAVGLNFCWTLNEDTLRYELVEHL